jgi:hypothetical protein
MVAVSTLFEVVSGDFHALKELEPGDIPLVSCGDTDNGVIGYYDIPADCRYRRSVTVAYNGSWPIMAKFHPYVFGAKDDVAVLMARYDMTTAELVYVAALLTRMTWRYSYGRKCFREKLENVQLPAAVVEQDGVTRLDTAVITRLLPDGPNGIIERITRHAGEALAAI